jgi:hypothetical protein
MHTYFRVIFDRRADTADARCSDMRPALQDTLVCMERR